MSRHTLHQRISELSAFVGVVASTLSARSRLHQLTNIAVDLQRRIAAAEYDNDNAPIIASNNDATNDIFTYATDLSQPHIVDLGVSIVLHQQTPAVRLHLRRVGESSGGIISDEHLAPITAVAVVRADMSEEPPYGFTLIDRATSDTNTHRHEPSTDGATDDASSNAAFDRSLIIAVCRGNGAPISNMGITHNVEGDNTSGSHPAHIVRRTATAHTAELLSGGAHRQAALLSLTTDIAYIIRRTYHSLAMNTELHRLDRLAAHIGGLLTAIWYCADEQVINETFDALSSASNNNTHIFNAQIWNAIIVSLCDAAPLWQSYFSSQSHTHTLTLLDGLTEHINDDRLTANTYIAIINTCLLARHEDKYSGISLNIIQRVVKLSPRSIECACRSGDDTASLVCSKCRWAMTTSNSPTIASSFHAMLTQVAASVVWIKSFDSDVKRFTNVAKTSDNVRVDNVIQEIAEKLTQVDSSEQTSIDNILGTHHNQTNTESLSSESLSSSTSSLQPSTTITISHTRCIHLSDYSETRLYAITLSLCRHLNESTILIINNNHHHHNNNNNKHRKNEIIKRKIHSLRLLLSLLQNTYDYYNSSAASIILLRRFICPALLQASITDTPVIFRLVLTIITCLYHNYNNILHEEIGCFFDYLFHPLLESHFCSILQKRDILDVMSLMLNTPQKTIDLFYNYDNALTSGSGRGWKIFERLCHVLSKLAEVQPQRSSAVAPMMINENDTTSSQTTQANHQQHKHDPSSPTSSSSMSSSATSSTSAPSSSSSSSTDSPTEQLRRQSLKFFVLLLQHQSQWLTGSGRSARVMLPRLATKGQSSGGAEDENAEAGDAHPDSDRYDSDGDVDDLSDNDDTIVSSTESSVDSSGSDHYADRTVTTAASSGHRSSISLQSQQIDTQAAAPSAPAGPSVKKSPTNKRRMIMPVRSRGAVIGTGDRRIAFAEHEDTTSTELSHLPMAAISTVHRVVANRTKQSTWRSRSDQQRMNGRIDAAAKKIAKTESLKTAMIYVKSSYPHPVAIMEMAHFLYRTDGLDQTAVGDILGGGSDSLCSHHEYEELRRAYLELLDFTAMSFDSALRSYLCHSGFRLPGEAQKIDRLLESFCSAYVIDNPDVFRSSSSAFILAFALVMLNTDLHDPRLKQPSATTQRTPMSVVGFTRNLRGVDDGHDFPEQFLIGLYKSIEKAPIEWQSHHTDNNNNAQTTAAEADTNAADTRSQYESVVRRAIAYLKNQSTSQKRLQTTTDERIVTSMFDVSWIRAIAAITAAAETSTDVAILHTCIDGLTHGAVIAVTLGLTVQRQAFTRVLAKLTFVDTLVDSHSSSHITRSLRTLQSTAQQSHTDDELSESASLSRRLIAGEHLRQEWYRLVDSTTVAPVRAVQILLRVCTTTKQAVTAERRAIIVRKLAEAFNHEISLYQRGRALIKDGKLDKLNSANRCQTYHFFLFNDILIYATRITTTRLSVHRVIQLSMCRIEDIRGNTTLKSSFRIVSPQKTIVVSANGDIVKQQWIDTITQQIRQQTQRRHHLVESMTMKTSGEKSAVISPSSLPPSAADTLSPTMNIGSRGKHKHTYSTGTISVCSIADVDVDDLSENIRSVNRKPSTAMANAHSRVLKRQGAAVTMTAAAMQKVLASPVPSSIAEDSPLSTSTTKSLANALSDVALPTTAAQRHIYHARLNSTTLTFLTSDSPHNGPRHLSAHAPSSSTSGLNVDESTRHCRLCLRWFTLFRRRGTCRLCRAPICSECAQKRFDGLRACDSCHFFAVQSKQNTVDVPVLITSHINV